MRETILTAIRALDEAVHKEDYIINWPHSYKLPVPMAVEERLSQALGDAESFDNDIWKTIRAAVHPQLDDKLFTFTLRMATLATGRKDAKYLESAITGAVLGGDSFDFRDLLIVIGAVHDASKRLDLRPETIIRKAARLATPRRADTLLNGFLARREEMKSLGIFGLSAFETAEGVRYHFF